MTRQILPKIRIQAVLRPDRLVDRHRFYLALDTYQIELAERPVGRQGVAGGLRANDANTVFLGQTLDARPEIDGIAHHRVRAAEFRAHVADAHLAGIDANADQIGRAHV